MTKICFVTRKTQGANPEVIFLSQKYAEAVKFFKEFNSGEGEISLFVHPPAELSKKLKSKTEKPVGLESKLKALKRLP